ncbi:hypothetical protein ENSA5_59830 [Enhygromyxa salina]|uniref:Uncharacterized protein n=1 Tax=Enhygromyxa salina TaxID=215803 RepID=A0A2S9XDG4_9BACT|nr:hypothetical protein [Enhygromyxa salina]PRP90908.1 hypothetical protein ENSA5_59830 [Enhygromyxa salina]
MRLLNILLGHTVVFGVAILVSSSCGVTYPTTAFRCSPGGDSPNCPTEGGATYQCCSDDPAALDLEQLEEFVTPDYQGRGGEGTPLFSGGNNPLSTSGMCVKLGSVPPTGALADINAQGCPVPCNPTWSSGDIASVCGANTICCQTTELEPEDCVFDPSAGDDGCYRPVTGSDIDGVGSTNLTNWAGTAHKTHQDPSGTNCEFFVQGLPASVLSENNISAQEVKRACWRRLTVANQRGFCLGGAGVNVCPLAQPAYRDACEQLNDANFLQGCGDVEFP